MLSPVSTLTRTKTDAVAAAAVDEARAALLEEVDAADVGDHLGREVDGDRVITHLFECRASRLHRLALGGHPRPGRRGRSG